VNTTENFYVCYFRVKMAQREILSANVHYDDDAGGGKSFSTSTTS
jgi:hypothetical protein